MFGDCIPCQQNRRCPRCGAVECQCPRLQLGRLGAAETGPTFSMKRDLIAGGVALASPFAYDKLAPKKWPKLGLLGSVATVVGMYFATSWAYSKVT